MRADTGPSTRRSQPGRLRRRRGATSVEVAIVLLPLLTFLIGIFEYARYMMVRNLAENACREGARYAVVHTYDKTTTDIQNQVTTMLAGQQGNIQSLSITVNEVDPSTGNIVGAWTDAKFGETIMVKITGTYIPSVPKLLYMSTSIPISVQATMLSEAN